MVLLELVDDSMGQAASFLSRALALSTDVPFGCKRLQLAERAFIHLRTHHKRQIFKGRRGALARAEQDDRGNIEAI